MSRQTVTPHWWMTPEWDPATETLEVERDRTDTLDRTYRVYLDGTAIGTIHGVSYTPERKVGRLRQTTGKRNGSTYWTAEGADGQPVGYRHESRTIAADALVCSARKEGDR
jgi:hypothetical protein